MTEGATEGPPDPGRGVGGSARRLAQRVPGGLRGGRLRVLVVARLVDQASLGLGSLLLAAVLGPTDFAPVAMLFVVNSLVIQVADLGVGFAVLRSSADRPVARASLARLRRISAAVAAAGLAVAAVLVAVGEPTAAAVVGSSAVLWALAGESRVRKSSALTLGAVREAAGADISGAVAFAVAIVAVAVAGGGALPVGLALVGKQLVELAVVRTWAARFTDDGEPARSGHEWLGQVMTYVVANADYAVLALLLGPADLSRYAVAFRMASALPALVANPITETAFLDLASADRTERQAVHDGIRRRVLALGVVGAAAVLVAAPVLPLVLGEAWDGVAPIMVVLSLAVPFRLLLGLTKAQAITVGAARAVVGWESARLVAVVSATALGAAAGGVVWATVGVSASTAVSISLAYVRASRLGGVTPWRPVLPASVGAALVAVAAGALLG